jgi:hypothetical protein
MHNMKIRYGLLVLAAGVSIAALYLLSRLNYLLFHSSVEVFSIVITFAIFAIAWNARGIMDSNYLLFIGIACLFVGGVDLLHTLAYKGNGNFPRPRRQLSHSTLDSHTVHVEFLTLCGSVFCQPQVSSELSYCRLRCCHRLIVLLHFLLGKFPSSLHRRGGLDAVQGDK